MARFQFSLANLLALTGVVGVVAVLVPHLHSESVLEGVWLVTLILAYVYCARAQSRGWRRLLIVTVLTSTVWMVCIFGTHSMYTENQDTHRLLVQAVRVTLFGAGAALLVASLVELMVLFYQRSKKILYGYRWYLLAALVLSCFAYAAWRSQTWEPEILPHANRAQYVPYERMASTTPVQKLGPPRWFNFTPDGRLLALTYSADVAPGRLHTNIQVMSLESNDILAKLAIEDSRSIHSTTFLPDANEIAAVVKTEEGHWEVMRWETTRWTQLEPISLDWLFENADEPKAYPLLVDGRLLLISADEFRISSYFGDVSFSPDGARKGPAQIQIKLYDLKAGSAAVREFPLLAKNIAQKVSLLKPPSGRGWQLNISRSGEWVIVPGGVDIGGVYGAEGTELGKDLGRTIELIPNSDCVVGLESWRLPSWNAGNRGDGFEPPFWQYRFEYVGYSRLFVFDCHQKRVLLRSRWHRLFNPIVSYDGRSVYTGSRDRGTYLWKLHKSRNGARHAK